MGMAPPGLRTVLEDMPSGSLDRQTDRGITSGIGPMSGKEAKGEARTGEGGTLLTSIVVATQKKTANFKKKRLMAEQKKLLVV